MADSTPSAPDFASILIAARKRIGLTQAEVATAAGLTASYLSFLENRKKPPPSEDVCRGLAKVLGLTATELVEIAQTERAPDAVRRRLTRLDSSLKRERRTRQRLLRSLLSPFLFAGPPDYLSDALGSMGLSAPRRRRLREALTAVGRHHQDRAEEVAGIIEALPEKERNRLLNALPELLATQQGGAQTSAAPETDSDTTGPPAPPTLLPTFSVPPLADKHGQPYRVTIDESWTDLAIAADDVRLGDEVMVDPGLDPAAGDLLVLRNGDQGAFARIEEIEATEETREAGLGAFVLLRANPAGHVWREPARSGEAWTERLRESAAAVVIEVRRPFRRRG